MISASLVFIHGFWSSRGTWNKLVQLVQKDTDLSGVRPHLFGYESPKLPPLPFLPFRIPDYNDIAQTLATELKVQIPPGDVVVVTHSQGGLILQRFLAWMLSEGRGRELGRVRLIVMLSCPNEGTEYLQSLQAAAGLRCNPQARDFQTFRNDVTEARRIVLKRIVSANRISDYECPIPIHVYAGRTDNVVGRQSAQSAFPNAGTLPGDHFSILDPDAPFNVTFPTLKKHLLEVFTAPMAETTAFPARQPTHSGNLPDAAPSAQTAGRPQIVIGDYPRRPYNFFKPAATKRLADTVADGAVTVIVGPRGAGKTQLAGAYMRSCFDTTLEVVAWINAQTRDDLLSGLSRVAEKLEVADQAHDSLTSALNLQEALEARQTSALLVLDNATDPETVKILLPRRGRAQVLITTSMIAFEKLGTASVEISGFTESEAIAYLRALTGLADDAGAQSVANELSLLPLALTQAGAMIRKPNFMSYSKYLSYLSEVPVTEMLGRSDGDDYPLSTAAAILLSVEWVEHGDASGLCRQVLPLLAVLGSQGVRRELLYAGLAVDQRSCFNVDSAIARCIEVFLLSWSADDEAVVMHRLVARVLRDRDRAVGDLAATADLALRMLESKRIPADEAWEKREIGDELVGHIEAVLNNAVIWNSCSDSLRIRGAELQAWAADQLRHTSDPRRAISAGLRALVNLKTYLREDDPRVWDCSNVVGWSYLKASQPEEGLKILHSTVESMKSTLGPNHPTTINARKNLAASYRDAGQLDNAIQMMRAVVSDAERVLGVEDEISVSARSCLAYALQQAELHDESIFAFQKVLEDRERIFGLDHPKTIWSRTTLAGAYHAAGNLREAIQLCRKVLNDRERLHSPANHPDITLARHNLAHALLSSGDLLAAISLFERNLRAREEILEWRHPHIIDSRINLATAYEAKGCYGAAVVQWKNVVSARVAVLGPDHPDSAWARTRLATARTRDACESQDDGSDFEASE